MSRLVPEKSLKLKDSPLESATRLGPHTTIITILDCREKDNSPICVDLNL